MPDPAERLTVAPEAPPSDAPRASTVQSIDPAPPTPSREPAPAMPPPDRAVQLVDKLGELVGVILLGWLAHGRVIDGTLGAVLICAVLGVNTGLRQIGARAVGAGHGLGVVGLVVAGASGYGAHVVHGARALFTGLVAALVVLALGCTSGPRSPNDTATQVVKVATLARATACDDTLDTWLGRTPPLQVDRAPETALEVVGQIRAWMCSDVLAGLLDTARELLTPRASPAARDAGAPDASPRPGDDVSPSAEGDGGATAATDAAAPGASPAALDDTAPAPTAATADGGTVTP